MWVVSCAYITEFCSSGVLEASFYTPLCQFVQVNGLGESYTHPCTRGSAHTPTHQRKCTHQMAIKEWCQYTSEHSNLRRHQKASPKSKTFYIRTYVRIYMCMHVCWIYIHTYVSYIDVCVEMATPRTILQTVLLLLPLCCCGLSMVGPVCHCVMSVMQKVCSFLACPCICLYLRSHTATAVCVSTMYCYPHSHSALSKGYTWLLTILGTLQASWTLVPPSKTGSSTLGLELQMRSFWRCLLDRLTLMLPLS